VAEGLIGGVLGDEAEEPGAAQRATEGFAAAVAASAANQSPEVATAMAAFFREQTELVKAQTRTVETEHEYFEVEWGPRLLGMRLRVGFQIFVALVATLIGVGAAILIRDAVTSRRVVIEPFDAPPALVARGLTGKVIAGALLDELSRAQDATHTSTAARALTGAWSKDIQLAVPETGISIGEISRLLRDRFGHDVHIDGNLVEITGDDLALTVRGNGVPAKTFIGSAAELPKLTVAAAEYVYSKSQPARWVGYLIVQARNQEAIDFSRTTVANVEPAERSSIFNNWANAILSTGGSTREALSLLRAAVAASPKDSWNSRGNIQNLLMVQGDEEGAWREGEQMRAAAGGRPGRADEFNYQNWDYLTWNLQPWLVETIKNAEAYGGAGSGAGAAGPGIADIQARLHDAEAAYLALKTTQDDTHDPTITALTHFVRGRLAAEAGDTETAAIEMEAFGADYINPSVATDYPGYHCWIVPAEEAAGHPEKADALLKSAGTYVDCYRFRADLLDGRGDWPAAQKAYAEAVALAQDLPAAYYSWGLALAKHGDLIGATAKLKDANQRGPHWADPNKAWGDVLAKQGKTARALDKYDAALKYAPNWRQLKEAREALAKHKT
jgi:tetratricopeptide (TPR) repeat protein